MSEKQPKPDHRSRPTSEEFRRFIASGWAPRAGEPTPRAQVADMALRRRAEVSAAHPGERLVVPAGGLKVRSNDTDYVFRPHTAFAWLTGLGADREPDAVLVLEPLAEPVKVADSAGAGHTMSHEAVLYFRPLAGRDTEEFFADSRYGEFWVGARPTIEDIESELGLTARHIDELAEALGKDVAAPGAQAGVQLRVVPDADPQVAEQVLRARATALGELAEEQREEAVALAEEADQALARELSTLRLVKDDWEQGQMRLAVEATGVAFDAVMAELPAAVERGRGERWVEGVFGLHARHQGNGVGYDSICAAGDHANTLHWIRNTGDLREGELLLLDAGVEVDSLFTADITRTVPVGGTFSPAQRRVYEAVLAAQDAGIAAVRPGARFKDVHAAAIRVIAEHLHAWGLLPEGVDVERTLDPDHGGWHRRWMVHGTSHHLGLDVHDCALALREDYMDGELRPGMVLTVEPALYFKADDELVPQELRGIGVRIEDDVLVTAEGCENLSARIPRSADEVEAWVRSGGRR